MVALTPLWEQQRAVGLTELCQIVGAPRHLPAAGNDVRHGHDERGIAFGCETPCRLNGDCGAFLARREDVNRARHGGGASDAFPDSHGHIIETTAQKRTEELLKNS
jgi:hypothetical protein